MLHFVKKMIRYDFCNLIATFVVPPGKDSLKGERGDQRGQNLRFRSPWLFRILELIDRLATKIDLDAFEPQDLAAVISQDSIVPIVACLEGHVLRATDESELKICAHDLDILISLVGTAPLQACRKLTRLGFWLIEPDGSSPRPVHSPAFWEVVQGSPVTEASIRAFDELSLRETIISSAAAPTHPWSSRANRNELFWTVAALMTQALRSVWKEAKEFPTEKTLDEDHSQGETQPSILVGPPRSNLETFRAGSKLAYRFLEDRIERHRHEDQWFLAVHRGASLQSLSMEDYDWTLLIPPKDRFWADPFPIKIKDTHFLFMEEFVYQSSKGHISVIQMNASGVLKPATVLERTYHLSYPCLVEWKRELFMIPETSENKTVEIYRCKDFPGEWEPAAVLLEGFSAVDPTVFFWGGQWWLFLSTKPFGTSSNIYPELRIFWADSLMGPWRPHRQNPLKLDVRSSRPAGPIFAHHGKIYRPSQDCSKRYGYAISINEVMILNRREYSERPIAWIGPTWAPDLLGTHHLASYNDLVVVDGVRRWRSSP